jgi:hypothetical protein
MQAVKGMSEVEDMLAVAVLDILVVLVITVVKAR